MEHVGQPSIEPTVGPYERKIPFIMRQRDDLSAPETREEQLFCWYYWLEKLQDPKQVRAVLDKLEYIPEFEASWGAHWKEGDKLLDKIHKIDTKSPQKPKPF